MPARPIADPPEEHREVIIQSDPNDWEWFDDPETWVLTTNRDYSIAVLNPEELEDREIDIPEWTAAFPDSTTTMNAIRVLYRGTPFNHIAVGQIDEPRNTIILPNTDHNAAEGENKQVLTEYEMHLSDIMSSGNLQDYDLGIRIED